VETKEPVVKDGLPRLGRRSINGLFLVAVGFDPSQFAPEISRELAISANAMANWRDTPILLTGYG